MKHFFSLLRLRASGLAGVLLALLLLSGPAARAQQQRQVVFQAFWWNYWNSNYPFGWANYVADLAPRLKALGIQAVWVPPSIKNDAPNNGYAPFDHYDLGDKFQRDNSTAPHPASTRLGTKDELLRMVAVLHANGIDVIQDVVPNHIIGAGSNSGAGGQDPAAWENRYKNFRYVSYATPATDQSEADYFARAGRWPKNWQNFHPNNDHNCNSGDWCQEMFGPDVCYYGGAFGQSSNVSGFNPPQSSNYMRNETRSWLIWYKKQQGFDGVRLDAVKHYPAWATEDFLYNLQHNAGWASGSDNMFAVGEFVGGKSELDRFCNDPNPSVGVQNRSGTFDFGLRGFQTDGFRGVVAEGGGYNLGSLYDEQQSNRLRTVPFVNNHDTFRPIVDASGNYSRPLGDDAGWNLGDQLGKHIDPRDPRLSACYAVALAVDGAPQIFFEDLFDIGTTGKRFSHLPGNAADLPVRPDLENLLWCRQNLRFMEGAYQERWRAADLFIIERAGKALVGVNDSWDAWQTVQVQTSFPAGTQLQDYSGASSLNDLRVVDGSGKAYISVPPCNGTALQGRRGYAVWAPTGIGTNFSSAARSTTQEWEMADDLGDSHCQSLGQGGRLPDNSTNQRVVGKIFVEAGKTVTYELFPTDNSRSLALALYDLRGNRLDQVTGPGNLFDTYTPTTTGWLTLKARNTAATYPGQRCFVKVSYTAPASANTLAAPPAANQVAIWTGNANSADAANCRNWESGLLPTAGLDVLVPAGSMFMPALGSGTVLARNFVIEAGATLNLAAGSTLRLSGNLVNQGSLAGTGTVELAGSTPQTLAGAATTFANLRVANPADVTLLTPVTVTGNLHLSTGRLVLGGQNLTLDAAATLTGADASRYLVTMDQPGGGFLRRPVPGGGPAVSFPVGTAASYTPLLIGNSGSSADFRVRAFSGVLENGTSGAPFSRQHQFVNRTWEVQAAPGAVADLTFQWNGADENVDFKPGSATAFRHGGGVGDTWQPLGSGAASGSGPFTFAAAGVSSFGLLAVGNPSVPLPVKLTAFAAERRGAAVELRWSTAAEKGNARFEVLKSATGRDFGLIGQVPGRGTTTGHQQYRFADADAPTAAYYRLRQVDFDGRFSLSQPLFVAAEAATAGPGVFPNPSSVAVRLTGLPAEARVALQLRSAHGRSLLRTLPAPVETANEQLSAALRQLAPGVYLLTVEAAGRPHILKLIKQ
ncbi:alpha-amylase family glycosyl hydrolase [Hymenobacter sp. B81]|uniref:alpha-amylase family glycosyl hydrolase n=1 Tax=Hymenobacter sp. B81 TaxID=3344878 RepID=UPI0037DC23D5